jgi:Zn-dependent membrane protease YugP
MVQWILLAGILLVNVFPSLLLVGIGLFAMTTVFSVITLPVEFDASNRALAWLRTTGVTTETEFPKAKDALKWAATTYVVAALASIVTLVQYILIYLGGRSRD